MEGPEIQFAEAVIDNGKFGTRTVRFETGRLAKQAAGTPVVTVNYRPQESFYIVPANDKVTVIFLVALNDETDRAIFRATRTLKGTPRWQMGPTTRKPASNTCSRIIAARSACS